MINYQLAGWKYKLSIRFLLIFVFILLFYLALVNEVIPQTFDVKPNTISSETIKAPQQFEHISATEQARTAAEQKIQPVYTSVSTRNTDLIEDIFNKLELINTDNQMTNEEKAIVYRREFSAYYSELTEQIIRNYQSGETQNQPLAEEIKQQLNEQQYRIPEETYFKLPRLTQEDLTEMEMVTRDIVLKLMSDQILNAPAARAKVAEMVNTSELTKNSARELVQEISRFVITPNKFLDETITAQAREEARKNTSPVYIEQNELIIKPGDFITQEIYNVLVEAQLLKKKVNFWPHLGLFLMVSLIVFVLFMFIKQSQLTVQHNNAQVLMLLLIFLLNVVLMKTVALGHGLEFPFIGYLMPIALGSILITILFDASLAFISSVILSIVASITFNVEPTQLFDFRFGFTAIIVCFVSIFVIRHARQRSTILKAGMLISLFSSISILSILLLGNEYIFKEILTTLIFTTASGLITAVLVVGLLPFFEIAFGILSPLKLVELSNPNHVLLRKLLTETPGTYHHSVMVGNLSEAAAEAIGADGLLCRVGSFYHDIGKTKRPSFFIENQVNIENPHDHIEPKLSKSIIIAHTRDGVDMLREHKMPKQICDIADQHHGTSLLKYFYYKAQKQLETEGNNQFIPEEDYRYPGPKAQTKEAAIVGIADAVEAIVRSLRNPTIEQIDSTVRKVMKDRLDDQQFNECDLTLKELDVISKSLKETLLGIFHSRIEYPEDFTKSTQKEHKTS